MPPSTQSTRELRFGLLGPVVAQRDGHEVALGGVKQRGVLAALLWQPGQVVTTTALIHDVWGLDAPASAPQMVKVFISRLRALLGDANVIRTGRGGYRMDVAPEHLDVLQAKAILDEVRDSTLDPTEQAARCADALALWRGEPLSDLAELPLAQTIAPALADLHQSLFNTRMTALLSLGRYEDVLPESRAAIARRPFDDSAHGYLLHALYLAGRQAEALSVYADYRTKLADELGVDPGQDLTDLHDRLLRQDPALRANRAGRNGHRDTDALRPGDPSNAVVPSAVTTPPDRSGRRRGWIAACAVTLLAAAGAAGIALSTGSAPHRVATRPGVTLRSHSVAEFDDTAGAITSDVVLGSRAGALAVDDGYVWAASPGQDTVTALSATTGQVVTTYGLPTAPSSLTPGDGVVWISLGYDGRLDRILISSHELTTPFFPDRPIHGFVATATSGTDLWVATVDGRLARLDSRNLHVRSTVRISGPAGVLTLTSDAAWSVDLAAPVLRRTSLSGHRSIRVAVPGNVETVVAAGDDSVWALTTSPDRLVRLDDAGRIAQRYALPAPATLLCVGSHGAWTAVPSSGVLVRHDLAGVRPPTSFDLGRPISALTCDHDHVWIAFN